MDTLKQVFGNNFNSNPSVANTQLLMQISDRLEESGEKDKALTVAHEAHRMAEVLIDSLGIEESTKYKGYGIPLPVSKQDFIKN